MTSIKNIHFQYLQMSIISHLRNWWIKVNYDDGRFVEAAIWTKNLSSLIYRSTRHTTIGRLVPSTKFPLILLQAVAVLLLIIVLEASEVTLFVLSVFKIYLYNRLWAFSLPPSSTPTGFHVYDEKITRTALISTRGSKLLPSVLSHTAVTFIRFERCRFEYNFGLSFWR